MLLFCLFVLGSFIVLPAKSDSDVMFCLQSNQGLRIDRSLVYQSYPQELIQLPLKSGHHLPASETPFKKRHLNGVSLGSMMAKH